MVIMLPPDPPITRIPPDFDSSTNGVIEEGGCSPTTTNTHHIRLKRSNVFKLIGLGRKAMFMSVILPGLSVSALLQKSVSSLLRMMPVREE